MAADAAQTVYRGYPARVLNGTAILRPLPDHLFVVQLDVVTDDEDAVTNRLRELTELLLLFTGGHFGGQSHSTRAETDFRGFAEAAVVGFGPSFFRDRRTGERRFPNATAPRHLDYLRLTGDDRAGIDPLESQTDLVVCLESENLSSVIDCYEQLRALIDDGACLRFVRLHVAATRGDGRNHLGQYDGKHNPTLYTTPSAPAVAFTTAADEAPELESGTYMAMRKYRFDLDAWFALDGGERSAITGAHHQTGNDLQPFPDGCHVRNVRSAGPPQILRRGMSYVDVESDESGLLFIAYQKNLRDFVRLHDEFLVTPKAGPADRLLAFKGITPLSADGYFVPDFLEWGYVGQVFFEPARFAELYAGARLASAARYREALDVYRRLAESDPNFIPAWTNQSDLLPDVEEFEESVRTADEALSREPNDWLGLSVKAWALYLVGAYEEATRVARRAIEACPNDAVRGYAYHTLGASLLELGRPRDAEDALRRSIARVRVEPLIYFSFGNALDAQQRHDEARASYETALGIIQDRVQSGVTDPRSVRNLFNMRFIRYRSDLNRNVLDQARAAVRNAPTFATAREE